MNSASPHQLAAMIDALLPMTVWSSKTLPQARCQLEAVRASAMEIRAAIAAASAPHQVDAGKPAALAAAPTSAKFASAAHPSADDDLLAKYASLTGQERKSFLRENAPALWQAHERRARAKRYSGA